MSAHSHVFISHIGEERELAHAIKERIDQDFRSMVEFFVSTDEGRSIPAGTEWFTSIKSGLQNATILLALCSPESIKRTWVNFECGAAWLRGIPVIPVCHSTLTKHTLPQPLMNLQAINGEVDADWNQVYLQISHDLSWRFDANDTAGIGELVRHYEETTGARWTLIHDVQSLIDINPVWAAIFNPDRIRVKIRTQVRDTEQPRVQPLLESLASRGYLTVQQDGGGIMMGDLGSYWASWLFIAVQPAYYKVAEEVWAHLNKPATLAPIVPIDKDGNPIDED